VVRTAVMAECRVLASMRRLGHAGLRPAIVWRRGRPLVELRAVALRGHQLFVKRVLDVVLSAAMLVAFAPVILLVALAVRVGSKGPVLYGQRRLGRHGQSFRCYKFRSMYPDAEQRLKTDAALYAEYLRNDYKLPDGDDPRITPVGRLLRRTSLDELPQLWNVLKGDMSLVGPRPIVPDEIRHYEGEGPMLLLLKPGITGLWQVSGRSNLAYPERTSVELDYVERWNLLGDIGILLRTVPAVLMQRGAH
jgi:lipopolysaccharide/colanic/teichoic acid biosynthesis glycosyltransferase